MLTQPPSHFVKRLREFDPDLRCRFDPNYERFVIERRVKRHFDQGTWNGMRFFNTENEWHLVCTVQEDDGTFRLPYAAEDIGWLKAVDTHRKYDNVYRAANADLKAWFDVKERKQKDFHNTLEDISKFEMVGRAKRLLKEKF